MDYYSSVIIITLLALVVLTILISENDRIPQEKKRLFIVCNVLIALSAVAECGGVCRHDRGGGCIGAAGQDRVLVGKESRHAEPVRRVCPGAGAQGTVRGGPGEGGGRGDVPAEGGILSQQRPRPEERIYDGTFTGTLTGGHGVTAALL